MKRGWQRKKVGLLGVGGLGADQGTEIEKVESWKERKYKEEGEGTVAEITSQSQSTVKETLGKDLKNKKKTFFYWLK